MTASERQIWYWRKECESLHRMMNLYPKGDERRLQWEKKYKNAERTLMELLGKERKYEENNDNAAGGDPAGSADQGVRSESGTKR